MGWALLVHHTAGAVAQHHTLHLRYTQTNLKHTLSSASHTSSSNHSPVKRSKDNFTWKVALVSDGERTEAIVIYFTLIRKEHTKAPTIKDYICLHSNILKLTNEFSISDQNITLENYEHWLTYLNNSYPVEVNELKLRHCDLQRFLDQV